MSRVRLTALVVAMLGLLPLAAAAQIKPSPCLSSACTPTSVPEPATLLLLASGVGAAAVWRARTKGKK